MHLQLKLTLALLLAFPILADDPPKQEDAVARLTRENEQLKKLVATYKQAYVTCEIQTIDSAALTEQK